MLRRRPIGGLGAVYTGQGSIRKDMRCIRSELRDYLATVRMQKSKSPLLLLYQTFLLHLRIAHVRLSAQMSGAAH